MNLYAFELGRKKELCFAELIKVLGRDKLSEKNLDTAIFALKELNFKALQDKLGGTIKIIKITDQIDTKEDLVPNENDIKKKIEKIITENFQNSSGKIPFSLCVLSIKNLRLINIKNLLNFSKKILKSLGFNSRFVNKDKKNPKPSTIYKAKVIEKGLDICLIRGQKAFFIGRTITIQDINSYSKRDYDKPKRDAQIGMLPPKLAQTMINLAGKSQTIYDPFCGTGTILMEGLLMSKDVVGSDINERMIDYSKHNCTWLEKEFGTKNKFKIFKKDARFIKNNDLKEKIDTIVTEGYLGPALSKSPHPITIEKNFRELANLHLNWLKNINQFLNHKGKIVMCLTAYKTSKKIEFLPMFREILKLSGFEEKASYLYDRPGQIVLRQIKVLEKIKNC